MKIGFIGLGIMGKPMAAHLKAAGHEVLVPERASLGAEQVVRGAGAGPELARITLRLACINQNGRPARLPSAVRRVLEPLVTN